MRIIAGTCKGMRLNAPPGRAIRPSSDLLRGAVMSQLGGFFHGEAVLDVCSGTGAMALEFLSRGCQSAVAIDCDPIALQAITANANHTRLADRLEVVAGDVLAALDRLAAAGRRFAIVYIDPPYDSGLYGPILERLLRGNLVAADAEVLVESRTGLDPSSLEGRFSVTTRRRYGSSILERLQPLVPAALGERAHG